MKNSKAELNEVLTGLKELKSKQDVIEQSYSIIIKRYRGKRFHTFWTASKFAFKSSDKLWEQTGFMDCIHQNRLLKQLLIGSGYFKESDISNNWTLYWYVSPHQYLKVRTVNGNYINLDPWSAFYGIKLGDYGRGFHTKTKE